MGDGTGDPFETCSGTFTDDGGADEAYTEDGGILTLCSSDENLITEVNFTLFSLAEGDNLIIYDGLDTDAPVIGSFGNGDQPGLIFASADNDSGCLTFEFATDGSTSPVPGWVADIGCREPCQLIEPELIDISPVEETAPDEYLASVNQTITFVGDGTFEGASEGAVYNWDFGDGQTGTGQTAQNSYAEIGTHTVTLTITGPDGCPSQEFNFTVEIEFNPIIVDEDTYTVTELVEDILIDNPCAQISNITSSTGIDFGDTKNGIAYFDGNNSSFPIDEGLILSTGDAEAAEGPETDNQGSFSGWPGDSDLLDIAQDIPDVTTFETNDATIIEFDFVFFSDQLSFNFLFAAEEYGTFQCSYSDVFAFLLTDESGNTTNLAVVPGTDTPVAVTTIKDGQYNAECNSANVEYFDSYYGDDGLNPNYDPTNFLGNTVTLTASAAINPGEQYHIKLAIADANDNAYDSAVFLEAGSFDIGNVDLGPDIDDSDPLAVCEGDVITLDIGLEIIEGVEITWFKDGEVIPGENGATLNITEAGNYTAEFSYNDGDCFQEDVVVIEFKPMPVNSGIPDTLFECNIPNGDPVFNLTENNEPVLASLDPNKFSISYYENMTDAENFQNAISEPENYQPTLNNDDNQTVYVTIRGQVVDEETNDTLLTDCSSTESFLIEALPSGVANQPGDLFFCDNDPSEEVSFNLTDNAASIIGSQDADVFGLDYYETMAGAENAQDAIGDPENFQPDSDGQQVFVRIFNKDNPECGNVTSFVLNINTLMIGDLSDKEQCDGGTAGTATFDLTGSDPEALDGQNPDDYTVTYYTGEQDAEMATDTIDNPQNYENTANPQVIFVRVANNNDPENCFLTTSFEIEATSIDDLITDPAPLQVCDDDDDQDPFAQTEFDLTQKAPEITGADPVPANLELTYYASENDLNADSPIQDPENYQNQSQGQIIYIEVADTGSGENCVGITQLTLEVLPLPSPGGTEEQLNQVKCDDNNDGVAIESFDLTTSGDIIADGQNFNLQYYKTMEAAESGNNASGDSIQFPGNYVNDPNLNITDASGSPTNRQVIYVRVESTETSCSTITQFELEVKPAPVLNPEGNPFGYVLCGVGDTDTAPVNLPDIAGNLYRFADDNINDIIPLLDPNTDQGQDLDNYDITYYSSEQNAEVDVLSVTSGDVFSDGDTLFVRVENPVTGCFNTGEIGEVVLNIEERPITNPIQQDLIVCSDEQGGQTATVDLTQFNGQINGSPGNTTFVQYYPGQDALENDSIIENPGNYLTTDNPQQIFAKVIDSVTFCESLDVAEIDIIINPRPVVDISAFDGRVICRDINPVTQSTGEDTGPVVIETGLGPNAFTFSWTRDSTELSEDGPSLEVDEAGNYQVVVTANSSGCQSSGTAEILESNPPEFTVYKTSGPFTDAHSLNIDNIRGGGDYEFRVDNGPWIEVDSTGTISFDELQEGGHTVQGRDILGCGTTTSPINFIGYPDFFTPNQDGYNDRWNVVGLKGQPGAKIYIFDRYGKLLKQLSPTGPGWDGTFNNKTMPSNDYWFKVEYMKRQSDGSTAPEDFKANFTLKR
jgi:gliding motility-associated-like protein